jgi:vacuolar-type H+-ATPase subunit E/Vma4
MSLERILDALTAEGQAEISRIEQEAEERACSILNQAETEAIQIRDEHMTAIRPHIESGRAQRINAARLAAQRMVLEARESLVQAAFDTAAEELASIRESSAYPAVLEAQINEVFGELGTSARFVVDPRDTGLVQKVLDRRGLDCAVEPTLDTWGGVVGYSHDGRLTVDNRLETRLEQAQHRLRGEVAAVFEKHGR